ncbi:MAG: BatA domain-containing protein [Clostridia bacterium]|nr:BatA domain-containing protein [Clostridia bacterium]
MSWITPLGFLGLLGIVVLIIIYLLKPNYQNKFISSTFVWKLSLKYKKKRLPISKLRNILLIICQILIITACACIFAQPVIEAAKQEEKPEKIVIIETSANMLTLDLETGESRFDRAIAQVKTLAEEVMKEDGILTVITAGNEASYMVQRFGADKKEEVFNLLEEATVDNYGTADVEGAMLLAEKVLEENPKSEVMFYTGTEYLEKGTVTVVDVAKEGEWNAAILDCRVSVEENLYVFSIDVACYNQPDRIKVNCEISGINGKDLTYELYQYITPTENLAETIRFDANFYRDFIDEDELNTAWVYSFKEVYLSLETTETDSFAHDNDFYIYGGEKERVDVQYYSGLANPFFDGALASVGEVMRDRWDIYVDTVKEDYPDMEGFDFYLFEHIMPDTLPTDGVVFLVNPSALPRGLDVQLGGTLTYGEEMSLSKGEEHPITRYVTAENINIRQYTQIEWHDDSFKPLLYCDNGPILLVKDTPDSKIVLFTGNIHMSDLAVRYEFPILMYNMIEYFFPSTLTEYVFEVGDTVELDARGDKLKMKDPLSTETVYEELPTEVKLPVNVKGVYGLSQTLISGDLVEENFYVKIPATESNIARVIDELKNPYVEVEEEDNKDIQELLIYFLAALVGLMFIEWWLQSRENM